MLTLIGALGGAGWGAWLARKRGGGRYDILQYAAAFGIFWGLLALLTTIFLVRA